MAPDSSKKQLAIIPEQAIVPAQKSLLELSAAIDKAEDEVPAVPILTFVAGAASAFAGCAVASVIFFPLAAVSLGGCIWSSIKCGEKNQALQNAFRQERERVVKNCVLPTLEAAAKASELKKDSEFLIQVPGQMPLIARLTGKTTQSLFTADGKKIVGYNVTGRLFTTSSADGGFLRSDPLRDGDFSSTFFPPPPPAPKLLDLSDPK